MPNLEWHMHIIIRMTMQHIQSRMHPSALKRSELLLRVSLWDTETHMYVRALCDTDAVPKRIVGRAMQRARPCVAPH
jgi:hypothetical protein